MLLDEMEQGQPRGHFSEHFFGEVQPRDSRMRRSLASGPGPAVRALHFLRDTAVWVARSFQLLCRASDV